MVRIFIDLERPVDCAIIESCPLTTALLGKRFGFFLGGAHSPALSIASTPNG
jgi:hypothetical protein